MTRARLNHLVNPLRIVLMCAAALNLSIRWQCADPGMTTRQDQFLWLSMAKRSICLVNFKSAPTGSFKPELGSRQRQDNSVRKSIRVEIMSASYGGSEHINPTSGLAVATVGAVELQAVVSGLTKRPCHAFPFPKTHLNSQKVNFKTNVNRCLLNIKMLEEQKTEG